MAQPSEDLFERIKQAILFLDDVTYRYENCVFIQPTIEKNFNVLTQTDTAKVSYFLSEKTIVPEKGEFYDRFSNKMHFMADYLAFVDTCERIPQVREKIIACMSDIKPPFLHNDKGEALIVFFEIPLAEKTAINLETSCNHVTRSIGSKVLADAFHTVAQITKNSPTDDANDVRAQIVRYGEAAKNDAFRAFRIK